MKGRKWVYGALKPSLTRRQGEINVLVILCNEKSHHQLCLGVPSNCALSAESVAESACLRPSGCQLHQFSSALLIIPSPPITPLFLRPLLF